MANPTLSDVDQKLNTVIATLTQIQATLVVIQAEHVSLDAQLEEVRQLISTIEAAVINLGTPGV